MRNTGPCLCGDTQCPSCGTAQGTLEEDRTVEQLRALAVFYVGEDAVRDAEHNPIGVSASDWSDPAEWEGYLEELLDVGILLPPDLSSCYTEMARFNAGCAVLGWEVTHKDGGFVLRDLNGTEQPIMDAGKAPAEVRDAFRKWMRERDAVAN